MVSLARKKYKADELDLLARETSLCIKNKCKIDKTLLKIPMPSEGGIGGNEDGVELSLSICLPTNSHDLQILE